MKAILVNGSPRRTNWNTVSLLKEAERGLKELGFKKNLLIFIPNYIMDALVAFYVRKKKI